MSGALQEEENYLLCGEVVEKDNYMCFGKETKQIIRRQKGEKRSEFFFASDGNRSFSEVKLSNEVIKWLNGLDTMREIKTICD